MKTSELTLSDFKSAVQNYFAKAEATMDPDEFCEYLEAAAFAQDKVDEIEDRVLTD
jgi:hypothetical protein